MSLDYFQFLSIVNECKPLLEDSLFVGLSARDAQTFILKCKSINLLLCLRDPFMRIHQLYKMPETISLDFSRQVSKTLENYKLERIQLLNEDRILSMTFVKGAKKHTLIAEFLPKRSNIYLLDATGKIEYALHQTNKVEYQLPAKPQHISQSTSPLTSAQIEKEYELKESSAEFEKQKQEILRYLKTQLQKTQKKIAQDTTLINTSKEWPKTYHEGMLLQANMYQYKKGMPSIVVEDWERGGEKVTLNLDPTIPIAKEVESRFRKSKKMKASISHLERQIEMGKELETNLLSKIDKIESAHDISELTIPLPTQKKPVKKVVKAKPYHEFVSETGFRIWVGKKASDNETLTFSLANGSDWWFHAHGYPGSHVVLKIKKNEEPDRESVLDAMQLALTYSKAREQSEAEILCTQCKYVSRFGRGHTGKVQVSKHKLEYIKNNPARLTKLRARSTKHDHT